MATISEINNKIKIAIKTAYSNLSEIWTLLKSTKLPEAMKIVLWLKIIPKLWEINAYGFMTIITTKYTPTTENVSSTR